MKIRPALPDDVHSLYRLMQAFARFDQSEHEFIINVDQLSEALFGSQPRLNAIIIEEDESIVGFLNYYISYSSFTLKPCIWVEDVFIAKPYRSKGLGFQLFQYMKSHASAIGCVRLEWLVRRNNSLGIDFYKKIGAKVDDETIYVSWEV